jgi:hypothetical protein
LSPTGHDREVTQLEERIVRAVPDEDIGRWRSEGYVVVEGVLDEADLAGAHADLERLVPTFAQVRDEGAQPPYWSSFPYQAETLDRLALHPTIIDFAERALGEDVLLSHSEMLHKYAGVGDHDQEMHQDHGNNSMIVPSMVDPDQVASITYLTDVTLELGPTGVVAFEDGAPWRHQRSWSRADAPDLYRAEHRAAVPAGSTVFYTMRTFHRGTRMTAAEGCRHTLHVALQRTSSTWAGWRSFAKAGDQPETGGLLARLTPRQRSVIGFPKPGHPYWTDEAIADVQRRHPMLDLDPYRT